MYVYIYICSLDTTCGKGIENSTVSIAADILTDSRAVVFVVLF